MDVKKKLQKKQIIANFKLKLMVDRIRHNLGFDRIHIISKKDMTRAMKEKIDEILKKNRQK